MLNKVILAGLFGFIGGIARASVGTFKSIKEKKKFKLRYFLTTVLLSGLIGIFTGLLYDNSHKLSLIAGYAGTDIIEGLYKSIS